MADVFVFFPMRKIQGLICLVSKYGVLSSENYIYKLQIHKLNYYCSISF